MSKTLVIVVIAGLAVVMMGGVAWAKSRGYCGGPEHMIEHVSRKLELDETQKSKLDLLGESLTEVRDQWRQRRGEAKDQVLGLLEGPSFDRDKAAGLIEQRHAQWRERGDQLLARFADFSDSLNPAQREELRAMIDERFGHRRHGPGWSH